MKRLQKSELKRFKSLLTKDVKVESTLKKSFIFFPIDASRVEDIGGFDLNIKSTGTASRQELTPGLMITPKDDYGFDVDLSYANISYSPKFDMLQYLELVDCKCSKELRTLLTETECLIVPLEYVMASFEF